MKLLAILVAILLMILSLLHFYWVIGGRWGIEGAIPAQFRKNLDAMSRSFNFKIMTLAVAVLLMIFGIVIYSNVEDISHCVNPQITYYGTRFIAAIFILRAVGDFKIVGIFKNKSNDVFAINDTKYYVPLCLFIGLSSLIIALGYL